MYKLFFHTFIITLAVGILLLVIIKECEGSKYSQSTDTEQRAQAHLFNKKTRKLFLKLFKRKIKIPEGSSLSLSSQVSRPNIFPRLFNQEEGIITDAVLEWPMWLDLDDFAEAMFEKSKNITGRQPKSIGDFIGTERCFLYSKLEWILSLATQLPDEISHGCLLKFICETQSIHSFYPESPVSIAFDLIHVLLSPSFGNDDECYSDYLDAEKTGRNYGRCDTYDLTCPVNLGAILIRNFFPQQSDSGHENSDS